MQFWASKYIFVFKDSKFWEKKDSDLSSISDANEDQSQEEEDITGDVNDLEVLIEKRHSLQSSADVEWREARLDHSVVSSEDVSEEKQPVINLSECPLSRVRKWSSPGSTASKDDKQNWSLSSKSDHENGKSRKISSPSVLMSTKEVSPTVTFHLWGHPLMTSRKIDFVDTPLHGPLYNNICCFN